MSVNRVKNGNGGKIHRSILDYFLYKNGVTWNRNNISNFLFLKIIIIIMLINK